MVTFMISFGSDVNIFECFYTPENIRKIFNDHTIVENWLMFEGLLAEVQGELGLIPMDAAIEIKNKATLNHIDFNRIVEIYESTRNSGLATVRALMEVCEADTGQWVHYGTSSPELWENVLAFQLKQVMDAFEKDLNDIKTYLNRLADDHRHSIMVERSLGRQALPTTFGFVAAIWSNAVTQNLIRFQEARKRILTGFLKGAIGTYASHYRIAGEKCLEMENKILQRLGLYSNDISFSRHLERLTEFTNLLLMVAQTFEKIFSDIFLMQHDEIGELEEPYGKGGPSGSSSLPQKRNPVFILHILARCKKIRSNAAAFGETHVLQSHDTIAFDMENMIIPESCVLTGDMLHSAKFVLKDLHVYPEKMRKNLDSSSGLVMTEALVLGLTKKTGKKQMARGIVYNAVSGARQEGVPFLEFVSNFSEIREHLTKEEIKSFLSPENYLGLIDMCIDKVTGK